MAETCRETFPPDMRKLTEMRDSLSHFKISYSVIEKITLYILTKRMRNLHLHMSY